LHLRQYKHCIRPHVFNASKPVQQYVSPQAAHAALEAPRVTGGTGVQPRPRPKSAITDVSLQPYSRTQLSMSFYWNPPP